MSDETNDKSDPERLDELKAELARHFGKTTRWRAFCLEREVISVQGRISVAEEVLAAPSTGTVAEWLTHHLRLKGGKSFDVDEMLAQSGSTPGKDGV